MTRVQGYHIKIKIQVYGGQILTHLHIRGINTNMNEIIYKFFCLMIPQSCISAFNNPLVTLYSFDTFIADDEDLHVDIQLSNPYNGPFGPYVKYELFINGQLVESAAKAVLSKPKKSGKETMADKLEHLAQLCSKKIIAQEYANQKSNMIKQFASTQNQWES